MGTLSRLYNSTNLEKEITEFYTGVGQSSLEYVKSIILQETEEDSIEVEPEGNCIKILQGAKSVLDSIEKKLYKIPGRVIVDEDKAVIVL